MVKKYIYGGLGLVAFLVMNSCSLSTGNKIDPEAVIPVDSFVVLAVDLSDDDQLGMMKELVARFPNLGLSKKMVSFIDQSFSGKAAGLGDNIDFSYEKDLKPVFSSDFKVVASFNFPDELKKLEDFETMDPNKMDFYISVSSSKPDLVQAFWEKMTQLSSVSTDVTSDLMVETKGEFTYLTSESQKTYVARKDNLIFISNTSENRDAGVKRILDNSGMKNPLKEKNLGYLTMNLEKLKKPLEEFYTTAGMTDFIEQIKSMKGFTVWMKSSKDGLYVYTDYDILGDSKDFYKSYSGDSNELMKYVPADGMIFYAEPLDMRSFMTSILTSIYTDPIDAGTAVKDSNIVASKVKEGSAKVLAFLGMTNEELTKLESIPAALAINDVGGLFPGISVYLKYDAETSEVAKKLLPAINKLVDQNMPKIQKFFVDEGLQKDFLKRKKNVFEGNEMDMLYLDIATLPAEKSEPMKAILGSEMSLLKLELYYGLILKDNLFVLAFYPKFPEVYGKTSFADSTAYKNAVENVSLKPGMVVYADLTKIMAIADRYVALMKNVGALTFTDLAGYGLVKDYISTIRYIVGVSKFTDDHLDGESFIRIEKITK